MRASNFQVFQTNNPGRWQRFRWGSRAFIAISLLFLAVLGIALWRSRYPAVPLTEEYKKAIVAAKPFLQETKLSKEYKGFRQYISEKKPYTRESFFHTGLLQNGQPLRNNIVADTSWTHFPCGIRSAFYVAWDPQSYFSLKRCIGKVNLVLPEWFFIDPVADTVTTKMDPRGFDLMKQSGVRIMPMLSNNYGGTFRPEAISRIFKNTQKRHRLIQDVLSECVKNKFVGVNVDLEEMQEDGDEPMINFMKELSDAFHAKGLLVTQDVSPFNTDYNYKELSNYTDYLFLMGYDEYANDSDPGPVSSQKWIEAAVDLVAKEIPSNKIVLCIAGYGYDWSGKGDAVDVTYQQALTTAKESEADFTFDNDTYNLHYDYADDSNRVHQVYFTDAATNFNTMRFATEYGLAGTALWRLGSEDSRLWDFYNLDMRKEALQKFNFNDFNTVESSNDVDYIGDGEVLDVVSTPRQGHITPTIDTSEMLIAEEKYDSLPSMFVVKRYGKVKPKQLLLTFDDGPDESYTPQVLDILSRYHVPAAFFLVGMNAENNLPLVKRIYREGFEIGNHTFTHPNMAEVSSTRAKIEMKLTRLIIECITGHSTILFRAPYNADSEPELAEEIVPVANARLENYLDVGESIDPEDWQPGVSADTIFQRVVTEVKDSEGADTTGGRSGRTILLHDAGGDDRSQTIKALPRIIEYFQKRGYTFITISELVNKKKEELMPAVPKGSGYNIMQVNLVLVEIGYWGSHFLFSLFIVFIILSCIRLLSMMVLAIKQRLKSVNALVSLPANNSLDPVSIIVPAYNEEVNAVRSLQNLLRQDYPNFNIVFVDDGSKDATFEKVKAAFKDHPKVQVFTKPNGGKASALNFGIAQTNAPYVVCIDADTQLKPDAVSLLMRHFTASPPAPASQLGFGTDSLHLPAERDASAQHSLQPTAIGSQELIFQNYSASSGSNNSKATINYRRLNNRNPLINDNLPSNIEAPLSARRGVRGKAIVGAVAGNVKVGNARNVLTRWQDIEYISSQNFDRQAFAYINAITVVPGAIGAFSKQALEDAGGFTTDTLAEDCDLTIRILKAGYRIENENAAVAMTEAPETLSQFLKQRTRWSFGVMQTFWKHRETLFNNRYGTLGWVAMPNMLLFQFIIPFFSPLADVFMLIGLVSGNASRIGRYYLIFMLIDAAIAIMAFWFEKEDLKKLVWLIPQRLCYRWIMYVVLFRSFKKAIKGELQHWGVLKRTGNVQMKENAVSV